MSEAEFNQFLGYLSTTSFKGYDGQQLVEIINGMMTLLDSTDADDFFGTEGWRRDFGWEN